MIVTKLREFNGHKDSIYTACINYPRQHFYTAGGDGIVASWICEGAGDGEMQVRVGSAIYSICLFQNKLLLGSSKGNFYSIGLESKKEERNIEAHREGIFDIVHDGPGKRIYTCGFDGVLNIWSEEFELLKSTKLSDKSLRNICLLPGAIAIASSDFNIYILDKDNYTLNTKLESHQNSVFALAYNPLKQELLSGGRDCYLKIWDAQSFQMKKEYVAATLHINHISFNPGFSLYAVSSMDKTIKIFDAASHQPLKFIDKEKYEGHSFSVNKTLWLNDNTLISVGDDKKAISWSLDLS